MPISVWFDGQWLTPCAAHCEAAYYVVLVDEGWPNDWTLFSLLMAGF